MKAKASWRHADHRQGFTILEVLVSIGVLGLLLALLLPAVQHSREASRNVLCKVHLRELGVASQNYHDAKGSLPQMWEYNVELLPYLDQAPLYESLIERRAADASRSDKLLRSLPRSLAIYMCPSDQNESHNASGWGSCQYFVNGGSAFPRPNHSGLYRDSRPLRFRDVPDGLSQTALFAERLTVYSGFSRAEEIQFSQADPVRFEFFIDRDFFDDGQEDEFARYCQDRSHLLIKDGGFNLTDSQMCPYFNSGIRVYDHILPPNAIGCVRGRRFPNVTYAAIATPATSLHPGGVNCAFCDGSVHFISEFIDLGVWRGLGTRDGHERLGTF